MAYKCKRCGQDVTVSYINATLMVSMETPEGSIKDIQHCPKCGHHLYTHDDLEFIPDDEYHREDERTAAL